MATGGLGPFLDGRIQVIARKVLAGERLSFDEIVRLTRLFAHLGVRKLRLTGGEPLLHRDMPKIVKGYLERKKFVILCTNALLLTKKIDQYLTAQERFEKLSAKEIAEAAATVEKEYAKITASAQPS